MDYQKFNNIHTAAHNGCETLSGGEIRQKRGDLVEHLIKDLWESMGENYVAKLQQKHIIEFPELNTNLKIGCDVDLYKNNELVCIVECKAYIDKCFLERAIVDFRYLRQVTPVPTVVVGLENAIAENTKRILEYVHKDVLTKIFFLVAGNRSSSKPLYNPEFFRPISEEYYEGLVNFLKSL